MSMAGTSGGVTFHIPIIFIVILAAKIINGGRCYKCLGSTRLVEVSFSRVCTSVCKKKLTLPSHKVLI